MGNVRGVNKVCNHKEYEKRIIAKYGKDIRHRQYNRTMSDDELNKVFEEHKKRRKELFSSWRTGK